MSRWFRMYDEALDDPKVQRLSGDDFKGWVNLLCLASRHDGRLPPLEDVAFALRRSLDATQTLLERLLDDGLIDSLSGGLNGSHYAPHGWAKRQYKSDTSTDRVKRFRKRTGTVTETPPETETETETETEQIELLPNGSPPAKAEGVTIQEFVEGWNAIADRCGLARVQRMSDARKAAVRARIRQNSFEELGTALAAVERSKFLRGDIEGRNGRTWKADFDWFVKAGNFIKLLEGKYDH